MAVSTIGNTNGPWSVSNTTISDIYGGQRFYEEQERRYREEMERQRYAAMQNTSYNSYAQAQQAVMTDLEREKQAVKPKYPEYTSNKKLLLLEN